MGVERRGFLRNAAIGGVSAASAAGLAAPALSQQRIEWRHVTLWPPTCPAASRQKVADRIGR